MSFQVGIKTDVAHFIQLEEPVKFKLTATAESGTTFGMIG